MVIEKGNYFQDYQRQMMSACEILDLASSGLYIASQRLDDDASKEIRTKVINASKDVLQGTMKVHRKPNICRTFTLCKNIYMIIENGLQRSKYSLKKYILEGFACL